MKNVTITLDDEVARWVRARAAQSDTSLSRLVGGMLRRMMEGEDRYETAQQQFFAIKPRPMTDGSPLPSREELHARSSLR